MGTLAWVLGSLGGLCGIMGLIVATEAIEALKDLPAPMTAEFWILLAILLVLGCIASLNSRVGYD